MYLTIRTPEQKFFEGTVSEVTLPGGAGAFQVLKDHAPVITTLVSGVVIYSNEDKVYEIIVGEGVAEINNNTVTILCSKADRE